MPTYQVTYSRTDYFEKEYEAFSYEDAENIFENDPDKFTYNAPYHSEEDFLNIAEV